MMGVKRSAGFCLCVAFCFATIGHSVVGFANTTFSFIPPHISNILQIIAFIDKSSEQTKLKDLIVSIRAKNMQDLCAASSSSEEQKKAKLEKISTAEEIAGKQKGAKTGQHSAAEEKIKNIIKEIEEEQKAATKAEEELMQEITGLIIEETMTKIGYEFYEYFFLLWEPPQTELKYYNIVITERASPIWGSLVEVKIGENTVWNIMLRPRSEEIEESAKQAIEATKNYLQDYDKYQFKTIDLMGTGI